MLDEKKMEAAQAAHMKVLTLLKLKSLSQCRSAWLQQFTILRWLKLTLIKCKSLQ